MKLPLQTPPANSTARPCQKPGLEAVLSRAYERALGEVET